MRARPWILGINLSHNGAACLLHGDEIVVAIQEERLDRCKRRRIFGAERALCVEYCLAAAGIRANQLDLVVAVPQHFPRRVARQDITLNPALQLGVHGIDHLWISHHLAHAASAFATSGFGESAVLVVDGQGSSCDDLSDAERSTVVGAGGGWEAASLYHARDVTLEPLEKHLTGPLGYVVAPDGEAGMSSFNSLGGIFTAVASQIFGGEVDAGKVMGLAPYGEPVHPVSEFFEIVDGRFDFRPDVSRRFRGDSRWPDRDEEYRNLAASAQAAIEEGILHLARRLHARSPGGRLCYAGGVALNSVTNERILREVGFAEVHVVPAAEDSGCALGAAYLGLWQLTRENTRRRLRRDSLGRSYGAAEIARAIERTPCVEVVEPAGGSWIGETVRLLAEGRIVGWFQGGSEFGPRALGQRTILCDPRRADAKELLNRRVKHREAFRPFAPVVPREEAHRWFDVGPTPDSPFMLRVCPWRRDALDLVPAVVHVDGTGRLQTVTAEDNGDFYTLVRAFGRETGIPVLLATSFNVMGEPIVETPEDALWCLLYTGVDVCVLGDRVVRKTDGYRSVLDLRPRVVAERLHLEIAIAEGRVDLGPGEGGRCAADTVTPWGPSRQALPAELLGLLQAIDGASTGWDLLDRLDPGENRDLDAEQLVVLLGRLRRARVIDFSAPRVAVPGAR